MSVIKTIFKLYLLIISIFFVFRLVLLLNNLEGLTDVVLYEVLQAFFIGLRFDIVISGYLLIPSLILLTIQIALNRQGSFLDKFHHVYLILIPALSFLVYAIDIPYFMQFFQHVNSSLFLYFDEYAYVFKMIMGEYRYWMYGLLFATIAWLYSIGIRRILNLHRSYTHQPKALKQISLSVLTLFIMLIGVRGRLESKSPIQPGMASFSSNSLLNKLGVNPNFNLIHSIILKSNQSDESLSYVSEKEALDIVLKQLKSDGIRREVHFEGNSEKSNVVLVIMESMSASKMARYGNELELTPFLDSIVEMGYSFDRTYTSGIHTFNGVFSTLYSLPSLYDYHPMKQSYGKNFSGIATSLKEHKYHTSFFTTHDGQFDNMQGFLLDNGFDQIVSLDDYPKDQKISNLGVPDDYMFEYGLQQIDRIKSENDHFLAVFLTASDHGPFIVPEYYEASADGVKNQIVQYADWSLKKLVDEAQKRAWFDNTYFVFVADHGCWTGATYQMPLTYHHSPFIIYAPKLIEEKKTYSNLTSQMDLYPTIMGVLKQDYVNEGFGIDARVNERDYVFFTSDESIGIIDGEYFSYINKDQTKHLYKYKEKSLENLSSDRNEKQRELNLYLKASYKIAMPLVKND